MLERLRSGGHSASISQVEDDGQVMYRVRVGPFDDRAEADATAARVNRGFKLDTWVRRLE